jgi:hypothetical protein
MLKPARTALWLMICIVCGLSTQTVLAAPLPIDHGRIWYTQSRWPILELPGGQRETVRSVLNVKSPMRYGDYIWDANHVPNGKIWLRVDLAHQELSVFRDGHEIGSAVILYGGPNNATPKGIFTILDKQANYFSRKYRAPMPYALRLTGDGVAIHGSDVREGWATHGCIGVPVEFARLIFSVAHKGDLVAVL